MKRVSLFLFLAIVLIGCDKDNVVNPTPDGTTGGDSIPQMVVTGNTTFVTTKSAILWGTMNMDISKYSSVEFGMMYSADRQELADRVGEQVFGDTLNETNFSVTIRDLTSKTKYYYRAFVCLNGEQYKYGEIKHFTTAVSPMGFSVSVDKCVSFAPGNLQYTRSTKIYSFAEHQYDMIGKNNVKNDSVKNDSVKNDSVLILADTIDLFGWSTNNTTTPFGVSISTENADYTGDFVDWGTNQIGDSVPNTWRTLTIDEWEYLFMHTRWTMAKVNDVLGLMLLPNDFQAPKDMTITILGDGNISSNDLSFSKSDYASNVYTADQFALLETQYCVFLPCAGCRNGLNVGDVGFYGNYWSDAPNNSDYARNLRFGSTYAIANGWGYHYLGHSVRLVRDIK